MAEMTKRYQREQALMLSIIHSHGMDVARNHLAKQQQNRTGPNSWLGQQRRNVRPVSSYYGGPATDIALLQLGQTLRR
jgi:protein HOOK3